MKPYKLTCAIIGGQTQIIEALAPLGKPLEHKTTKVDEGTLHLFTWIYEELAHAAQADDLCRQCLDDFGRTPDEYHVMTFVCSGPTWEPLQLVGLH